MRWGLVGECWRHAGRQCWMYFRCWQAVVVAVASHPVWLLRWCLLLARTVVAFAKPSAPASPDCRKPLGFPACLVLHTVDMWESGFSYKMRISLFDFCLTGLYFRSLQVNVQEGSPDQVYRIVARFASFLCLDRRKFQHETKLKPTTKQTKPSNIFSIFSVLY